MQEARNIFIFGDDIIGSVDPEFDFITTPSFFQDFYKPFGMKIKYVSASYGLPLSNCDFLGFKFHNIDGLYYPLYDIQRLATSMIYKSSSQDTSASFVSRSFTLFIMSYPSPHFEVFKQSWHDVCDHFSQDTNSVVQSYLTLRNVKTTEIIAFYQGSESVRFFDFFEPDSVGLQYNQLPQQKENVCFTWRKDPRPMGEQS